MSDDAIRTALLNMGNNPEKITAAFEAMGANRTRQDIDEYAVETSLIAAREQTTVKPHPENTPEKESPAPVIPATPPISQPMSKPVEKTPNLPTAPAKPVDVTPPIQPISQPAIKSTNPPTISQQIAKPINIPAVQPAAPAAPKHLTPEEFMARYGVQAPAQPSVLQKEVQPVKEPLASVSPSAPPITQPAVAPSSQLPTQPITPANSAEQTLNQFVAETINKPVQPSALAAPPETSARSGKKIALIVLGALLALALGVGAFFLLGKAPNQSPQIDSTSTTAGDL
ncbi:MAG: hypothetical protein Q7T18_09335 [Sedimentisphaerales bacterium]|nr:hypothetical protein [Sedimentisphaerales bacterium]